MKLLLSILLFITSSTLQAAGCSQPENTDEFESPIAYMDDFDDNKLDVDIEFEEASAQQYKNFQEYNKALNAFLQNNDNINIQLLAFSGFLANPDTSALESILANAIKPSSDALTLHQANIICHNNKDITDFCHQNKIHETHYQVDPDNIFTYLLNLHKEDSLETIEKTLEAAAYYSNYANSFYFDNILEHATEIESFNQQYPEVFNKYLDLDNPNTITMMQEMELTISDLQLIEKGIINKDYLNSLTQNSSTTLAMTNNFIFSFYYYNLIESCKQDENAENCISIAKLMMKDKTIANQSMSMAILDIAQQQLGMEQPTKKGKTISEKLICYGRSQDIMYAKFFNTQLMKQYILDAQKHGEVIAQKKLAEEVYKIEKKNGFNPNFNPNDC